MEHPKHNHDEKEFRFVSFRGIETKIWIESDRIDACMEQVGKRNLQGIAVSPLDGFFKNDSLDFLEQYPSIESLTVLHAEMVDVSAINRLPKLRHLQLSGKAKQIVDLGNFPFLEEIYVHWWPKLILDSTVKSLRVLSLSHYGAKQRGLADLPEFPRLEDLQLIQSSISDLSGIDQFPGLQRLALYYLPKLENLTPLAAVSWQCLKTLEFGNCPNIANHAQVAAIQCLRVLRFNHCGTLPSLGFLDEMPSLESFAFVGTNVVDGDLSPCLRLKAVGFLDKRHYSHRSEDFPATRATRTFS